MGFCKIVICNQLNKFEVCEVTTEKTEVLTNGKNNQI